MRDLPQLTAGPLSILPCEAGPMWTSCGPQGLFAAVVPRATCSCGPQGLFANVVCRDFLQLWFLGPLCSCGPSGLFAAVAPSGSLPCSCGPQGLSAAVVSRVLWQLYPCGHTSRLCVTNPMENDFAWDRGVLMGYVVGTDFFIDIQTPTNSILPIIIWFSPCQLMQVFALKHHLVVFVAIAAL